MNKDNNKKIKIDLKEEEKDNDLLDIKKEFDTINEEFIKAFGNDSVCIIKNNNKIEKKDVLSSGSLLLDNIILPNSNNQGYVKGKIIEIYGLQSSGKSTLALHAIKECQQSNKLAALFDLENSLDYFYAKKIGINLKQLVLPFPNNGEETFDMMCRLIERNIGMIVIDSVSNLIPKVLLESNLEKQKVGSHAALMSSGLRKLKSVLKHKDTIVIFINQIRKNISTNYFVTNTEVTTGGMALHFDADLRIKLKSKEKIEKENKVVGIKIEAKIVKNKFAPPEGNALIEVLFETGIDRIQEMMMLALDKQIIERRGHFYFLKGEEKTLSSGIEELYKVLEQNKELRQKISNLISNYNQ